MAKDIDRNKPGEMEITEIRLVIMHRPGPLVGHDPMRVCLDALKDEQDVIVLENVKVTTRFKTDLPNQLRKGE